MKNALLRKKYLWISNVMLHLEAKPFIHLHLSDNLHFSLTRIDMCFPGRFDLSARRAIETSGAIMQLFAAAHEKDIEPIFYIRHVLRQRRHKPVEDKEKSELLGPN